jgi:hypothetical protein
MFNHCNIAVAGSLHRRAIAKHKNEKATRQLGGLFFKGE